MLTTEELTEAHSLLDPSIPDAERKRPTLELLRRMLATIDAQTTRNKTLERKCTGLEQAATTALAEMHAAIDRAEKAEAALEDSKLEQEELEWANKIAVWAYARAEKAEARCGDAYEQMGIANNRIQQESTARMALQRKVAELQAIVDKVKSVRYGWNHVVEEGDRPKDDECIKEFVEHLDAALSAAASSGAKEKQ